MDFKISFSNQEITPWSGLAFLRRMLEKMKFSEHILAADFLPQPGSNRGYSPLVIITSFMMSIWCGANRFLHTEVTRHDKALTKIFGFTRFPGNDAFKRFFRKFDLETSSQLSDHLFGWVFDNIKF